MNIESNLHVDEHGTHELFVVTFTNFATRGILKNARRLMGL